MISRFVNLFKKNDLDEQRVFQKKVHTILSEQYPDRLFKLAEDPLTLEMGETVLGLTNLKSNFLLSSQTNRDLRDLIEAQFDAVFKGTEHFDREELSWDDAKLKLMPQLMPAEFLTRMDLVHFPFADEVVIGFVIDSEKAYSYVRLEELSKWRVSKNEVRTEAVFNLIERSKGIEMIAVPGKNGMFVVNTLDGFDAVRIIDKELQQLIGENIGLPFYAGIPNRDFLVCWSKNDDREFQNQMHMRVSNDFDERPYPLSRNTFEVSVNGEIRLADDFELDPRALSAETN